ncbi:MAG: hypothetical protein IME99_09680 [Proteobacteria bacterium]|nr:hypothetical protein [Pseudomonadota bacterium]
MFLSLSTAAEALDIDAKSAECIECHETTVDPANPARVCHAAGCNHPLGLDYVAASSANPGLTPASLLGPAIKLVGKGNRYVGCTTCHVAYSKANHETLAAERAEGGADPMLSTSNEGSFLCLGCHQK